tara:strand:+ start:2588 stop:2785 length:198 start_codon:yes stop_codon:yes gene_type:complete
MKEQEVLSKIPKRKGNGLTRRYGVFGLSLGENLYNKLDTYCNKKNITKSGLIKLLLNNYLEDKNV